MTIEKLKEAIREDELKSIKALWLRTPSVRRSSHAGLTNEENRYHIYVVSGRKVYVKGSEEILDRIFEGTAEDLYNELKKQGNTELAESLQYLFKLGKISPTENYHSTLEKIREYMEEQRGKRNI